MDILNTLFEKAAYNQITFQPAEKNCTSEINVVVKEGATFFKDYRVNCHALSHMLTSCRLLERTLCVLLPGSLLSRSSAPRSVSNTYCVASPPSCRLPHLRSVREAKSMHVRHIRPLQAVVLQHKVCAEYIAGHKSGMQEALRYRLLQNDGSS